MVDGVDMSTRPVLRDYLAAPKEEIEPFDFELNDKLRQLYGRVDELTLEIARLRRNLPGEATKIYNEALEKRRQAQLQDEEVIVKESEEKVNKVKDEIDKVQDEDRIEQLERIKQDYYGVIEKLGALIKTVPESKAQVDQLEEALEFVQHSTWQ